MAELTSNCGDKRRHHAQEAEQENRRNDPHVAAARVADREGEQLAKREHARGQRRVEDHRFRRERHGGRRVDRAAGADLAPVIT